MRVMKALGIGWGLVYFMIGVVFSFTLSSRDFWSGAIVYLALFLLPLPIACVAVWFPRFAGMALFLCALVSITVSVISAISSGSATDIAGICKFAMYHVPHFVFAVIYIKTGRAMKGVGSGDEGASVGTA
jgi:hypothetical protein